MSVGLAAPIGGIRLTDGFQIRQALVKLSPELCPFCKLVLRTGRLQLGLVAQYLALECTLLGVKGREKDGRIEGERLREGEPGKPRCCTSRDGWNHELTQDDNADLPIQPRTLANATTRRMSRASCMMGDGDG